MQQQVFAPKHFFGYGSLVNRATHTYPNAAQASLAGWRRTWVHTPVRPLAFLSVEPDPNTTIQGLIAHVPNGDWAALDAREHGYNRHLAEARLSCNTPHPIQVYAVPQTQTNAPATAHPILLSYIDVVVQGFMREFGAKGAEDFFATTTGWHAPIINDRNAPQYPRAQRLTDAETAVVDAGLSNLGATLMT